MHVDGEAAARHERAEAGGDCGEDAARSELAIVLDPCDLAIGEHVTDVGHDLGAEGRGEPDRVDRVEPAATWSKPATHVTAKSVPRAMTELATTNRKRLAARAIHVTLEGEVRELHEGVTNARMHW